MLFWRSSSDNTSDIDSRLAAFDESYAQRFPDDPQPWNDASPARTRRLFLGKTRWWWFPDEPRLAKPFRQIDLAARVDELLHQPRGNPAGLRVVR